MKRALLPVLFLSAIGCGSNVSQPPRAAPEPSPWAPAEASNDTQQAAECARLCKAYEHYRMAAVLECDNGECGGKRVHPETAKYGREMCESVVAQCGTSCPVAYRDHPSSKAKQ